ncbi:MAG TPA: hypothetical protein PKL10_12860, partial [Nitrospira sp.]|nr:hypothetical protein [Nitrospira sp.]
RLSLIEMAQDNDVLWSTESGGSEDFFFMSSMLKTAARVVLADSDLRRTISVRLRSSLRCGLAGRRF